MLINYFIQQVNYYFFDVFKLYQYDLSLESTNEKVDYLAATSYDLLEDGTKSITIMYSLSWLKEETSKEKIQKVAFHEVMEALLSELVQVAESRYIMESMVPNAIHSIIRTLENTVFHNIPVKAELKQKTSSRLVKDE